jgi:protein-L-isoaspartate(D-aspartate) O-methyltransferase
MVATDIRQRYAEEIRANTNVTSAALLKAFASVAREIFAGPGPWKVLSREGYTAHFFHVPVT